MTVLACLLSIFAALCIYLTSSKQSQRPTPLASRRRLRLRRVTVGVCIGTCVGVSAMFLATLIAATLGAKSNGVVAPVFAVTLAACIAWSFLLAPARAATELLSVAAVLTAAVPLTNIALSLARIRPALLHGRFHLAHNAAARHRPQQRVRVAGARDDTRRARAASG